MKQFDTVEIHKPAKNVFNMSHDVKATYNFDKIYPFFCKPVYPGDTFNVSVEMFMRAMPMLAPVMHNVDAYIWFFECPDRIIFNENRKRDFKVWVTGGEDGKGGETDTLPPVALPTWSYPDVYAVNPDFCRHGSLMDHLGFPTIDSNETVQSSRDDRISSLPFRAYQEFKELCNRCSIFTAFIMREINFILHILITKISVINFLIGTERQGANTIITG